MEEDNWMGEQKMSQERDEKRADTEEQFKIVCYMFLLLVFTIGGILYFGTDVEILKEDKDISSCRAYYKEVVLPDNVTRGIDEWRIKVAIVDGEKVVIAQHILGL